MTRARQIIVLVSAAVVIAGCSPKPTEFDSSAQRLLEDELAVDPGGTWTVTCTEPADIEVDTTFSCTATDGQEQRTYTARITSRSKFVVTADAAPSSDAAPASTVAAGPTTVAAPPTSPG